MEQLNSRDDLFSEELLNFANDQVDKAISHALNSLVRILSFPCVSLTATLSSSSSTFQKLSISPINNSLQPNISIRCRSSSRNNRRERKVAFHHTIPRCSLPATTNDLVLYQSRLLSYPQTESTTCRSSQNINGLNRNFDVQYSFSLNKPWLTKIDKQRHNLISIQNFVNELVEHSIRTALIQIDYQHITNNFTSIYEDDASCLLFDCSLSYGQVERLRTINVYVDQLIQSTIKQSIDDVSSSNETLIERMSSNLTEEVINDAISTISMNDMYSKTLLTDDEKHSRKTKKRSTPTIRVVTNENNEGQTRLFHQIRHRSTSTFRTITNNNNRRGTVDCVVNNLAQKIYTDTFDELRQIFLKHNGK